MSNAQVSKWCSSMFHNRYLLGSILKYKWKEFHTDIVLSKRENIVILPSPCAMEAHPDREDILATS